MTMATAVVAAKRPLDDELNIAIGKRHKANDFLPADVEPSFIEQPDDDSMSVTSTAASTHTSTQTPQSLLSRTASSKRYPSQLKTIPCPYENCEKTFNRPARLKEHVKSHQNIRSWVCPHDGCGKDFLRDTHLKHHIKSAHSEVREYACTWPGCDKAFVTGTRLRRHIAAHEEKVAYTCQEEGCGMTFRKKSTLQKHTLEVHQGVKPFKCEYREEDGQVCGKTFGRQAQLDDHTGRIHGKDRYFCLVCTDDGKPLGFPTYAASQEHKTVQHPPVCEVCQYRASTQKELARHMDVQHGGQPVEDRQTWPCDYADCDRSFVSKRNLHVHRKAVHEGSRPFICGDEAHAALYSSLKFDVNEACHRDFATKGTLQSHIRNVHLGEYVEKQRQKREEDSMMPDMQTLADQTTQRLLSQLTGKRGRYAMDEDDMQEALNESMFENLDAGAAEGEQFWLGGLNEDEHFNDDMAIDPLLTGMDRDEDMMQE